MLKLEDQAEFRQNSFNYLVFKACFHALMEQRDETLAALDRLAIVFPASRDFMDHYLKQRIQAICLIWLGETEEAVALLEKMLANGPAFFHAKAAARHLVFYPIWQDPVFRRFVEDPRNNAPAFSGQ